MKSSTQLLLVIAALVGTGLAAASVRAADSSTSPDRPLRDGRKHTPPPEIMAIYDVDQSGTLDEDERAVLHEDIVSGKVEPPYGRRPHGRHLPPELFARYDANQDGKLDDAERAALHADIASGKIKAPGRPGMHPPPEILAQYDTNQDGQLDEGERAVLHADIASGKLPPPRHGRSPHAEAPSAR